MQQHLVVSVQFLGDVQQLARFHGMSHGTREWPPTPARLFQALLAGVSRGVNVPPKAAVALRWLESLAPPLIASPPRMKGQDFDLFVPNNDADSLSDPRDPGAIRARKRVEPSLFSTREPVLYAWRIPAGSPAAEDVISATYGLFQFGRGVDMAWACGELLDDEALEQRLLHYRGEIHHPQPDGDGECLACPTHGSLDSLMSRFQAVRLRMEDTGHSAMVHFTNAPKPRFREVGYHRARRNAMFLLQDLEKGAAWPWPIARVVRLVERIRDGASARLRTSFPELDAHIEGTLVGRKRDGRDALPPNQRVRIVPLPSIGSEYADQQIRRFLLQVPTGGPIPAADVEWAFTDLVIPVGEKADRSGPVVVRDNNDTMFRRHYQQSSTLWQTVTPVVVPESARRRRIEPGQQRKEAKDARERIEEENRAVAAVHTALRHASIRSVAVAVRVQREPFHGRGTRAEVFADGTRFEKERLWHVEIRFDREIEGPLTIGDGRFLGLGLLAPIQHERTDGVDDSVEKRHYLDISFC